MMVVFSIVLSVCHSEERSDEESRKHKVGVTEILRFALDDIEGILSFIEKPDNEPTVM